MYDVEMILTPIGKSTSSNVSHILNHFTENHNATKSSSVSCWLSYETPERLEAVIAAVKTFCAANHPSRLMIDIIGDTFARSELVDAAVRGGSV